MPDDQTSAERARASRRAQGLPAHVEDTRTLERVARIFRGAPASSTPPAVPSITVPGVFDGGAPARATAPDAGEGVQGADDRPAAGGDGGPLPPDSRTPATPFL